MVAPGQRKREPGGSPALSSAGRVPGLPSSAARPACVTAAATALLASQPSALVSWVGWVGLPFHSLVDAAAVVGFCCSAAAPGCMAPVRLLSRQLHSLAAPGRRLAVSGWLLCWLCSPAAGSGQQAG